MMWHVNHDLIPAWKRETPGEQRWPAALAIAILIALEWLLPEPLSLGPRWLFPGLQVLIIVVIVAANPGRLRKDSGMLRTLSLMLIGVASLGNVYSVGRLVYDIVGGHDPGSAGALLMAGGAIYLINVLTFAVWFWELDRGGPVARAHGSDPYPDFLFAPMTTPDMAHKDWEPEFLDYFYLAFTNATAFSPTDTLPMSRWGKFAMAIESAISLITAALVVAKAVNALH
jgi:uncharacterized membrane protein